MPDSHPSSTLKIHEIYRSIQGESTYAGLPCTFVRLTACDLRCVWCDTEHAFYEGQTMQLDSILQRVRELDTHLVEITGGEPLLQPNVLPLMSRLCDLGHTVLLETGGHRDIAPVDPRVSRIMDLKCPDSGMSHRNRMENIPLLRPRDEVKFVLASRTDYEWARDQIHTNQLHQKVAAVLLSAVFGKIDPRSIVDWMLADSLPARLQLQMHKLIWPPNTQGV